MTVYGRLQPLRLKKRAIGSAWVRRRPACTLPGFAPGTAAWPRQTLSKLNVGIPAAWLIGPACGGGVNEFTLTRVEVVGPGLLQLAYADGVVLRASVLHIIGDHPSLWSLLDPNIFAFAEIGEAGASVTWGRDGLKLASHTIRALAIVQALD